MALGARTGPAGPGPNGRRTPRTAAPHQPRGGTRGQRADGQTMSRFEGHHAQSSVVPCRGRRLSLHQRPRAATARATSASYTGPPAGKCQIPPRHINCQTAPRRQRTCGTVGRHSQLVGARGGRRHPAAHGLARRVTSSWALPVRGSAGRICHSELARTAAARGLMTVEAAPPPLGTPAVH